MVPARLRELDTGKMDVPFETGLAVVEDDGSVVMDINAKICSTCAKTL